MGDTVTKSDQTTLDAWTASVAINQWQREALLNAARRTARDLFWDVHDPITYKCPICGFDGTYFEVHHRNGDALDNRLINLVAVCHQCHRQEHRRRNIHKHLSEWKEGFLALGDADA
jgi:hypothetical protein